MAFSMSFMLVGSHGWTMINRLSGIERFPTCCKGVGVP